jgi:hypothetical protein
MARPCHKLCMPYSLDDSPIAASGSSLKHYPEPQHSWFLWFGSLPAVAHIFPIKGKGVTSPS